jgi:hypothetical protein
MGLSMCMMVKRLFYTADRGFPFTCPRRDIGYPGRVGQGRKRMESRAITADRRAKV